MTEMRVINREFFDNLFTDLHKTKFIKSNIVSRILENVYSLGYNSESCVSFLRFLLKKKNEYTKKSVLQQILISFSLTSGKKLYYHMLFFQRIYIIVLIS